jgi:elongation factor G
MELEVVVPDDHVGDVVGDLHARRGKIAGIEARLGVQVIACLVPLEKMFGYSTDLRSRTQGRATYSMQLSKYNEVPAGIREDVVARVTGA